MKTADLEIEKLSTCIKEGKLCAINRDMIDDLSIYCYPLWLTDQLVLVANVYDFQIDGYKILRTDCITEVFCGQAEAFNERIMQAEGVRVNRESALEPLPSFKHVCMQLKERNETTIVQCESYEESRFFIGRILEVRKTEVLLRTFDGLGIWDEQPIAVPFSDITCVAYGGRYATIISKYLRESE